MSWRDIVLGCLQILLLIALLPSVSSRDKPALFTSVLTGWCMMGMAFVYATMAWAFSAIVAFAMAYTWFVLAAQVYKRKKVEQ